MQIFVRSLNKLHVVEINDKLTLFQLLHHLNDITDINIFHGYLTGINYICNIRDKHILNKPAVDFVEKDGSYMWNFAFGTPKYILFDNEIDTINVNMITDLTFIIKKDKSLCFKYNVKSYGIDKDKLTFQLYKVDLNDADNYQLIETESEICFTDKQIVCECSTVIIGKHLFVIKYNNSLVLSQTHLTLPDLTDNN